MINYRIRVFDNSRVAQGDFVDFKMLRFGDKLNDYGMCEFKVKLNDEINEPSFILDNEGEEILNSEDGFFLTTESLLQSSRVLDWIKPRQSYIEIIQEETSYDSVMEGGIDGKGVRTSFARVWAGEIAVVKYDLKNNADNWATVYAYTWEELLSHRYTEAFSFHNNKDAGEIIEDEINRTNGESHTGITVDSTATSNRTRTYRSANILELIQELSQVQDGFDFTCVTPTKSLRIRPRIGTVKSDTTVFEYGTNIDEATIVEDFKTPVNRAIVLGEVDDNFLPLRVDSEDASSISTYGLREGRQSETSVTQTSTLTERGEITIEKYKQPLSIVNFRILADRRPTVGDFSVGDTVAIVIKSGRLNISRAYRVYGWQMTVSSENEQNLELTVGEFFEL